MSTILQPCFESQFIETTTVKLKFAPPPPPTSIISTSTDISGLSFQQVLAGICSLDVIDKDESIYVHPLSNSSNSSSRLSEKSFEMCTENLGSETGTDDILMDAAVDSCILSSFYSSSSCSNSLPSPSSTPREYSSSRSKKMNYKAHSNNFPPPLTTITGANSIQVRPHRENGRLVLKAIETPVRHTYLQAERNNGRLKLTLYNYNHHHLDHLDDDVTHDSTQIVEIDEQEQDQEQEEEEEESSNIKLDEDLEEINDQEHEDDDDGETVMSDKEMDPNNNYDIHELHEMGMEKYQSLSRRCNESGGHTNTVLHKLLWVATS